MWICTGRWGCGAFAGDGYLKFLIQWIAASLANRNMVYIVQEEEEIKQLRLMVGFLKNYCTNDILEVIQEYAAFK
jgi:poly(ADP-ribose) glycohydrolase